MSGAFAARPLNPWEYEEALALAREAGVQGVYVANWLAAAAAARPGDAELLALHGAEGLLGLCYFGGGGNLVVLEREPLAPAAVARAITKSLWGWRIVLARVPIVAALAECLASRPLVSREQVWYGIVPAGVARSAVRTDVRRAEPADLPSLVEAALQLNHSDLHVDPRRVNRAWLETMLVERIEGATTRVIGPPGQVLSKLDLGSSGEAGLVLEGVYTAPESRGRGLATGLCATVAAHDGAGSPLVCLHVGAENRAARRAYENAGMRELGRCGLMLRG